jgi:hypothetical protein
MPMREFNGIPHIVGVGAPCHQSGPSLGVRVPEIDATRGLITWICGENEPAFQTCAKLLERAGPDWVPLAELTLTGGWRQSQRAGCGEGLLDELATIVTE